MEFNIVALDSRIAAGGDLTWDKFRELGNFTEYESTSPDELITHALNADAVIVNKVVLDVNAIAQLPRLKYIGIIATGYDNVDIAAAKAAGITVTNVPAYSSDSVAQTVFALLLDATNHISEFNRRAKAGEWTEIPFVPAVALPGLRITELAGKTLAVYGLGNIGMKVAVIGHAFGMKIISPTRRPADNLPEWIEKVESADEMFRRADVLSLNAPLTANTRHIVNRRTLKLMKPSAIIINTARGGLIDTVAVDEALRDGIIAYCCVDVLEKEPPSCDNPLLSNPKCTVTPHIAWDSLEARERLMNICADNLKHFLDGNTVNAIS